MRICIITVAARIHGIGGMQDHTADLVRGLVGAGHEVEVITARHPSGRDEEWTDGAHWTFVDAHAHHMDGEWLARSYEAFASADKASPFDVVHSEGSSALELVRRGAHRRTPTVAMFHGNFLGLVKAGMRRTVTARRLVPVLREARAFIDLCSDHFPHGNWYRFRECEAIVPSHQQLEDTCRSHRLDQARVHVVPNGVDTEVFRPRPREQLRAELGLSSGLLFVCVGRLNREKGNHHAVKALSLLDDEQAQLVVVGKGGERAPLEELSRDLGLEARVHFVGAKAMEDVARYLAAADVFLFPTERDEAAPLVLPQAMSCGLPTIASSIGGITEVIDEPGTNGILIEPRSTESLLAAMHLLAGDASLRLRMGDAARQRILEEYTVERMVERTLAVYELARAAQALSAAVL